MCVNSNHILNRNKNIANKWLTDYLLSDRRLEIFNLWIRLGLDYVRSHDRQSYLQKKIRLGLIHTGTIVFLKTKETIATAGK